ncbi:MAG TPA: crotonase/enoyl-CoA hydratase family protein [Nevskia sp.]|jgi:enoyl-CoA hydratase|nr:crotonase/enoyl-CoA hydratase family protein [Nevskia sp.]
MGSFVSYTLEGGIATIAMDDGKVNTMSLPMQAELNAAFDRAEGDRATVLLTGRKGVFSAGFDLPVLAAGGADALKMLSGGFALAERLLSFPTPVVIACTGHALAMGVFLVASADYRIGAEGPYKIGANEVAIGMILPRAAIEICRARLAPAHFQRAMITAEIYSPADAVAAGFLDKVVAEAELPAEAQAAAARLAKLSMKAHAASKLLARERQLKDLRAAMEADLETFKGMIGGQ